MCPSMPNWAQGLLGRPGPGLGGSQTDPVCSCGEENLLAFPGDPYAAECILIHEFAHNIHLRRAWSISIRPLIAACEKRTKGPCKRDYGRANMPRRIPTNTSPKACSRGSAIIARTITITTMSTRRRVDRVRPRPGGIVPRSFRRNEDRLHQTRHPTARSFGRLRSVASPSVRVARAAAAGDRDEIHAKAVEQTPAAQ